MCSCTNLLLVPSAFAGKLPDGERLARGNRFVTIHTDHTAGVWDAADYWIRSCIRLHFVTLGLVFDAQSKAYPFLELAKAAGPVPHHVGQQEIVVHFYESVPAAWATNREGSLLPSITTVWSGWSGFFPETELFRVD